MGGSDDILVDSWAASGFDGKGLGRSKRRAKPGEKPSRIHVAKEKFRNITFERMIKQKKQLKLDLWKSQTDSSFRAPKRTARVLSPRDMSTSSMTPAADQVVAQQAQRPRLLSF